MGRKKEDLIGITKGYLTVIGYYGKIKRDHMWVCKCKCGKTITVSTGRITNDYMPHCGCYAKEKQKAIPKYSKTILSDSTLEGLDKFEGVNLIVRACKVDKQKALHIYDIWRKAYMSRNKKRIHDLIIEELNLT